MKKLKETKDDQKQILQFEKYFIELAWKYTEKLYQENYEILQAWLYSMVTNAHINKCRAIKIFRSPTKRILNYVLIGKKISFWKLHGFPSDHFLSILQNSQGFF